MASKSSLVSGRITTTVAKAKALKKFVEPLITKSKEDTTNSRRVVFSNLQDKIAVTAVSYTHLDVYKRQGLYRSLVHNMVVGVSEGYKKELELVGVGYRASNQGNIIELALGYTHNIFIQLPAEVKVETKSERNKNPLIILESCDKQLLGQVCSKIRSFRKPEPYKGKGIKFVGEVIRRKSGKSAGAK